MSRLFTPAALVAGAVLTIAALSAPTASAAPPPAASPAAASPASALGLPTLAAFQTSNWTADKTLRLTGDITGDGQADLVGFGDGGLWTAVAHADGTFAPATRVMVNFSFDQGWRVGVHPRWVTDITGDGRADVVGIGDAGVYTAVSNGDGTFGPITFAHLPTFGIANLTTLTRFFAVDTNGDGRTDLVSVGNDRRMFVATALGDGQFASPRLVSNSFDFTNYDFSFFTMADVTGDHRAEVLAIQVAGPIRLVTSSPLADGTYGPPRIAGAHFPDGEITSLHTIADVTGDGRADIVESDSTLPGTYVAVSRGDGTFTDFGSQASNGFGNNFGWNTGTTPRFAADLTADGRSDLIGMGNDGVWTAVARTDATYDPSHLVFNDFGFNQGWRVGTNPIYLTDVNGDGLADIVGYGNAGVYVALSTGAGGFTAVGPANAVTVPSVVGLTATQAGTRLTAVGLRLGTVTDVPNSNCDNKDKVSGQTPAAGTLTTTGTAVNITIDRLPQGQSCN